MSGAAAEAIRSPRSSAARTRPRNSRRCAWLFSIALFGYPVVANVIAISGVESRVLSIPFRIVVILFSIWVILTTKPLRLDRWRQLMMAIWFFYILRLIHDWFFTDLEGADFALQYFVASSVFPAIALMKAGVFEPRRFALTGFLVASLGAGTSLLSILFGGADLQDAALESGRLSITALDPVSLAYEATSGILCGLVLWRGATPAAKLFLIAVFVAMLWCVDLTGSKGPALSLVLCIGLWTVRNGQALKFSLFAAPVLVFVMVSGGSSLAARVGGPSDDESTATRLVILADSINQIAEAPLIGSAFVEFNSGYYPHNVFVEAALALGIPGALLFLALMVFGSWRAWKTLKGKNALLGLLYFQAVIGAATSGAIFGAVVLWITLAMLPGSGSFLQQPKRRSACMA
jgi:hypothetical protein